METWLEGMPREFQGQFPNPNHPAPHRLTSKTTEHLTLSLRKVYMSAEEPRIWRLWTANGRQNSAQSSGEEASQHEAKERGIRVLDPRDPHK